MFLKSLSLTNFRSIKSMSFDFSANEDQNRKWTVLLGENGCGKSSVLRAIALILTGSEGLPHLLGNPDAWIRNGAKSCRIDAVLQTAKKELRKVSLTISRGQTLKSLFSANAKSLDAVDAAAVHSAGNYFLAGYGVGRRPPVESRSRSGNIVHSISPRAQNVATMFLPDANLVSVEQWAMDLDYRGGKSSLKVVHEAMDSLLPGMTLKGIDRHNRRLVFKTIDGEVPLSELSDGYQSMAAWCGDLLYRITETYPHLKQPLNTRGVLLIDELDLHLHPVWRRRLVDFLNRTLPNFQIIATTHSALTAQQCGIDELYVIRREGQAELPALVPFVGEPRTMMLHQLLMSPMFGLESLDSIEVEKKRDQVRSLSEKPASKLTSGDKQQLTKLRTQLADIPDWDAVPKFAREQTALIKEVRQRMVSQGGKSVVSATQLRAKVKALGAKP